ncbi:hypothetical protein KRM28CT15_56790 [Krasilnikovia sp. M28-CT-15]
MSSGTTARRKASSHPGPPARVAPLARRPVTPDRSGDAPLDLPVGAGAPDLWKDHAMAAKPKTEAAEEAREAARRALQTSMDTRQ